MIRAFAQKIHEQDVDTYKKWLCDTRPINVRQGLDDTLSHNNQASLLKEMQIRHLGSKLTEDMRFARSSIRDEDGVVKLDDIVTLISNFNSPGRLGSTIRSRPQFVKLIYQYISYLPTSLYEAYSAPRIKRADLAGESPAMEEEASLAM